jgi:hypothetical protein
MTPRFSNIASVVALAVTSGCAYNVYSPPARMSHLESPAVLPEGDVALGLGGFVDGQIFGPVLTGGNLSVRWGAAPELDLRFDATVGGALHDELASGDTHVGGALAARVKWAPEATGGHLALTGGGGLGGSTLGGLAAIEGGLIVGFENRYFVPFLGNHLWFSVPFAAREVDLTPVAEGAGVYEDTAQVSGGWQITLGARIPAGPVSAYLGVDMNYYLDVEGQRDAAFGFSGGVELRL